MYASAESWKTNEKGITKSSYTATPCEQVIEMLQTLLLNDGKGKKEKW